MNLVSPKVLRLVVVAVVAVLGVAPLALDDYTLNLMARTLALGVLAVSVALLTGYAGLPTLGQVAPYAVGAYTVALMGKAGITIGVVQLVAAAVAAALFAAVTAPLVVQARGVTVLMITLAIGELATTAAGKWKSVTGGTDGLVGIPAVEPFWGAFAMISDQSTYWYVFAVAVVAVGATLAVLRSPAGLLLTGSRDHEVRMRANGHPVTRYLVVTFIGAGALAGIAGALLVTTQRYVSPADVAFDTSALVLLAVVVGGTNSIAGALIGAGVVVAGRDWLSGQWPGHGPLLLGALLIAAVYLLPQGFAGLGRRLGRRRVVS